MRLRDGPVAVWRYQASIPFEEFLPVFLTRHFGNRLDSHWSTAGEQIWKGQSWRSLCVPMTSICRR